MQKSRITAVTLILAAALGSTALAQIVSPPPMPLEGTFWRAVVVGDRQLSSSSVPGPYLVFEHTGRVSGSDGCNRLAGDFNVNAEVVTFARMESTYKMCVGIHDVQRMFDRALTDARRLVIVGDQLELFDASNRPLAIFRPAL